jgi:hypothetical protein
MTTARTRMSTTRILHANHEVREIPRGPAVSKGAVMRPDTLPEMFGISTYLARLSAVGRFHNG